jgi:Domain of unknown function (DUF4166)
VTTNAPLFKTLLGREFDALDARVREVHDGQSRRLRGVATIERGTSLIARLLCASALLPRNQKALPVTVQITISDHGEIWTRCFDTSAPMRSTLRECSGFLVERLGLATMKFWLERRGGGINWCLCGISAFGCSLPLSWFRIATYTGANRGRYCFDVYAELRGIGKLIRYQGELDVV